jgi:hypothetical protein
MSGVRGHAQLRDPAARQARLNRGSPDDAESRTIALPRSPGGSRLAVAQKQLYRWITDGGALHRDD